MARTAMIHARIEPDLKSDVEGVFHNLGLTTTEAIKLFFRQVQMRKGLPFAVAIPEAYYCANQADVSAGLCRNLEVNQETKEALEATDRGEGLAVFETTESFFAHLDSECEK